MAQAPAARKSDRRSERGDLLTYFVEELNKSRRGTHFPPVSIRRIAVKLSYLSVGDLYALRSKCEDGVRRGIAFGAVFWTEITPADQRRRAGGTVAKNGAK